MSTPKSVKEQYLTLLNADSGLSTFGLNRVFDGEVNKIGSNNTPCICVAVRQNIEEVTNVNTRNINRLRIEFICYIIERDNDKRQDQILDFENAIKKAVDADDTLSSNAIISRFTNTTYDEVNEQWPMRRFVMELEVQYYQTYGTRT